MRLVQPAAVLAAARDMGMLVIHTREGHLPDLSDAPPAKVERGAPSLRIGDPGPMGRILIRGGYVATVDRTIGELAGADVLIDGARIAAIGARFTGARRRASSARALDSICSAKRVMTSSNTST